MVNPESVIWAIIDALPVFTGNWTVKVADIPLTLVVGEETIPSFAPMEAIARKSAPTHGVRTPTD